MDYSQRYIQYIFGTAGRRHSGLSFHTNDVTFSGDLNCEVSGCFSLIQLRHKTRFKEFPRAHEVRQNTGKRSYQVPPDFSTLTAKHTNNFCALNYYNYYK